MESKRFNVLVIGSGAGMHIVDMALMKGMTVALIEDGPLGGTCLNRGCIPSKMLTYTADIINTIREAEKLSVKARVARANPFIGQDRRFSGWMNRWG